MNSCMQFGETPTHKGAARGGAVASAPCAGAGLPCCKATTKAGLQLKPGELCGMYHHHPRRRHCFEIALPPPPPSCVQTCVSNPPGLLIYFPLTCPTAQFCKNFSKRRKILKKSVPWQQHGTTTPRCVAFDLIFPVCQVQCPYRIGKISFCW